MAWKKLSQGIGMWDKPSLGSFSGKNPAMALAIDDSSSRPGNYIGLARFIISREGSPDSPGFIDKSKLHIVKSLEGINWKRSSELKISGIKSTIKKLSRPNLEFIGLEDPDIFTDSKGIKQVYFTIAFHVNPPTD